MEFKANRFKSEDIQTRVGWINNPAIHNTMYFDLPATIDKTKIWYENNIGNEARIDFTFRKGDEIVAFGGFTNISKEHKNAEFYVMVNPEMHNKGIGKQVSQWMFNYAFSVLKLNKIFLYTNDDNISAYSIYEKSGFKLEGIMREQKWKSNQFQNRRFYGLLLSEWEHLDWKKDICDEL